MFRNRDGVSMLTIGILIGMTIQQILPMTIGRVVHWTLIGALSAISLVLLFNYHRRVRIEHRLVAVLVLVLCFIRVITLP